MEKVVITGSSGRIGRALHWQLSQHAQVTGIDLSPSSATTHIQDITNKEAMLQLFEGATTVYHAAALHAPHAGVATDIKFHQINVEATQKICEAAMATGVKQLIFTSTTALYGYANFGNDTSTWITESTIPQPRTIYHRTKVEAENLLKSLASNQLKIRVIRMSRCFPEPAPTMAVYRLHRGVDYRDVASAHLLAATTSDENPYDVFVISGSTPFLPENCEELYHDAPAVIRKRQPELAQEFDRRGWVLPQSIDRVYDASYAKQKLGWENTRDAFNVLQQYDEGDFEVLPAGNCKT
ncbi:MAG: NAD(P)-dependent oxidoreductase [Cytophagales bacterium]|nr:NAD(P)-dependent oxidoreductase [Cytophagales bacterium]